MEADKIRDVFFKDELYYSINDVISALTGIDDPEKYLISIFKKDEELVAEWADITVTIPSDNKHEEFANIDGITYIMRSIKENNMPLDNSNEFIQWLRGKKLSEFDKNLEKTLNYKV